MRRCIEFQKIETGSVVVIQFTDPVNVEAGNLITGAISMKKGFIEDGNVMVNE